MSVASLDTTNARSPAGVDGADESIRRSTQRHRRRAARERRVVWAGRIVILVVLVGGMKIINARSGDLTMPNPVDVVRRFWEMLRDGSIPRALGESLIVLGIGYGLAAVVGVVAGVLLGGSRLAGRIAEPFVHAMNATPRVAFIPLIIVWLGLRQDAKVAVTWLSAVVPILVNTTSGIENADADLTEMARSFGARRRDLFWRVWVPAALPSILTGLRVGASLAILGTVVAELYTAQAGLGGLMVQASSRFQMDRYFAVVLVLMALGVAITSTLRMLERRAAKWRPNPASNL